MRARLVIASMAVLALAGCSFLLSEDFAADDAIPPTEAGAADTTTGGDAVVVPDAPSVDGSGVDADADSALDPSLLAFWTFDKGTSLVQKDETQRYDMVLTGASIDPDGGLRGGAVVFVGSESPRVDALSGANFPKQGTLSVWFKNGFPDSDLTVQGLFDDWDIARSHVFIRRTGDVAPGRFQVALQPKVTSSSYAWVQGFDAAQGQWTHLVLTWDSTGKTAGLYVNGVIVKQSGFITGETFDPGEQNFQVSDGFLGSVDEVRLYDRALPPAEALLLP